MEVGNVLKYEVRNAGRVSTSKFVAWAGSREARWPFLRTRNLKIQFVPFATFPAPE